MQVLIKQFNFLRHDYKRAYTAILSYVSAFYEVHVGSEKGYPADR